MLAALLLVTVGVRADQPPPPSRQHVMLAATDLKWNEGPKYLPRGAQMTVIAGDMNRSGLFVVRFKFPANYFIPPHWHSADEHITVLSGSVSMGMGEKDDARQLKTLEAGGHAIIPAKAPHFLRTSADAVVQRTATGPFRTVYVNRSDDPSIVR
jgi:quercetin dioxygenase-like cupin family protein